MNARAEATAEFATRSSPGAIPWDQPQPVADLRKEIQEICEVFDTSSFMQLSYDTLVGELLYQSLKWTDENNKILEHEVVPSGWDQVVMDCIKGFLVAGVCFYRKGKHVPVEVAHPTLTYYGRRWKAIVVHPPYPVSYARQTGLLNSPCRRALPFELQLREHNELHANRSRINSRPGIFLQVDKRIQTESRNKPWFRTVGSTLTSSTLSGSLDPLNETLDHLVEDRADVIKNLATETISMRKATEQLEKKSDSTMPFKRSFYDGAGKMHDEHIISDGYEGTATPHLQSLVDARAQKTDLENSILYAMGVAPSCVGRNVNSERLSSSNQLVMYSLHTYRTLVTRYKRVIGEMLAEMSKGTLKSNASAKIIFPVTVPQHEIDRVLPHLTASAAKDAFAATYQIPKEWIDQKSFEALVPRLDKQTPFEPPAKKTKLENTLTKSKRSPLNAEENVPT